MNTRTATIADLPALLTLYGHLAPDDPPLDPERARTILHSILESNWLHVFVAEDDDAIRATCYLNVVPNLTRSGRPYAVIENVVTHARYRRAGYGKAVVTAALEHAWRQGCYKTMLLTGSKTEATHEFYRACGFRGDEKAGYVARPERDTGNQPN